jgi:hypothetical protein
MAVGSTLQAQSSLHANGAGLATLHHFNALRMAKEVSSVVHLFPSTTRLDESLQKVPSTFTFVGRDHREV